MVTFFKKNLRGFTLVELLVVVALIALLVGFFVSNTTNTKNKARTNVIILNLNSLRQAAGLWVNNQGSYAGFCADNDCNSGSADWKTICSAVKSQNGNSAVKCNLSGDGKEWCVSSILPGGGDYCADSANRTGGQDCGAGYSCP